MTKTPSALQLENEQLQCALRQAQAELEDFTYSVSHDLRASLRHVSAYVELIKEDLGAPANPDLLGHLETVSTAARQMGRQMDGLLELSRLGRMDLHLSLVEVAPLVRDVCAELAPMMLGRQVQWAVAPDIPALQADGALLQQALMHLLSNALKFTRTRALAEIQVAWQIEASGQCALTVSDNGVGFNPPYASKLFHVFQRLHSAREFEGLGMGLALTRKIVERHGGAVSIIGAADAGCRISITLPLASWT